MDPWAIYKPPRNNFHLIPIFVKSNFRRTGTTLGKTKELRILEIQNTRFQVSKSKLHRTRATLGVHGVQITNKVSRDFRF